MGEPNMKHLFYIFVVVMSLEFAGLVAASWWIATHIPS
jgi:hypothetical protein